MSCELSFTDQLMSALPQSPTSPSSRFAEVTNLNQDLTRPVKVENYRIIMAKATPLSLRMAPGSPCCSKSRSSRIGIAFQQAFGKEDLEKDEHCAGADCKSSMK